jgi:hypothetical protein
MWRRNAACDKLVPRDILGNFISPAFVNPERCINSLARQFSTHQMKFTIIAALAILGAFVRAGNVQHSTIVEIETIHIIEYTEICECPSSTASVLPIPAITTISCCDTCPPVTITAATQPVSSWTTCYTPTTTVCQETGVFLLGESFYPCNTAPCTIPYDQPYPTCYVCAYSDCWAPEAVTKPKHVKVYEYCDDNQVGYWEESWMYKVLLLLTLLI